MEKFTIEQTLNVLIQDIGIDKFRKAPNHIHKLFPRRKTYTNLWVVATMPWSFEDETLPRKWDDSDRYYLRNYIWIKYNAVSTYTVIKDATLCLKNRCLDM